MHLIAEITNSCPAKCAFCVVKRERKGKSSIDLQTFRDVLDIFEPNKITISGGEPSTVSDLEKYVNLAKTYGSVTVVTNCFNPAKILACDADFIQVSLDAYGNRHDEVRGIDGLWENAVYILRSTKNSFIRFTLMDSNIDDLRRIRQEFPEKKIFVMPEFHSKIKPTTLRAVKEEKLGILPSNCPMGKQVVITAELDVLPCPLYRRRLGNLRKDPHKAIEKLGKLRPYPCGKHYADVVATTYE
jgi:MoaA/NifB/PqqE/SkfB family radical SAM enzyme